MTVRRLFVDGKFIEVTGEGYEPQGEFVSESKALIPADNRSVSPAAERLGRFATMLLSLITEKRPESLATPPRALWSWPAAKAGLDKAELQKAYPRLDEIPFESEKQYMATLHASGR